MLLETYVLQDVAGPKVMGLTDNKNYVFAVLPDGNGDFMPCPDLLTEDEAIRYLRLDIDACSDSKQTLKYYRDKGELIAIKVGKKNRYRRQDLDDFLAQKSEAKRGRLAKQAAGL